MKRVHRVQAEREARALPREEDDTSDGEEEQLERQRPEPPHPFGDLLTDEVAERRDDGVPDVDDPRCVPVAGGRHAAKSDGDRVECGEQRDDTEPPRRLRAHDGSGPRRRLHGGPTEHRPCH
jgi:hypothetical protein